jgi:hypothetical protein
MKKYMKKIIGYAIDVIGILSWVYTFLLLFMVIPLNNPNQVLPSVAIIMVASFWFVFRILLRWVEKL